MSKRSKKEGQIRVHQEVISNGRGFMVVKTLLLPDGQVAAELTAVDTDKGTNASIGLDPSILSHLIWQHRGLRAAWRREQYRKERAERAKVQNGA